MKHLMTLAMVLAAGSLFAAAEVSSQIVGYNTQTVKNGMNLVSVPFYSFNGAAIDLQSIPGAAGDMINTFDQANNRYVSYVYADNTYGKLEDGTTDWNNDLGKGWADDQAARVVGATITPDQGFWLQAATDKDFTVSGNVAELADTKVSIQAGMNLIAVRFPVDFDIQNVMGAAGDMINTFDQANNRYVTYVYADNTYGKLEDGTTDWNTDLGAGWADDQAARVTVAIKPGQGFWFQAAATKDLTIKAPVAQ